MILPPALMQSAARAFSRFPDVLYALGQPMLEEKFELPPSSKSYIRITETPEGKQIRVVLGRRDNIYDNLEIPLPLPSDSCSLSPPLKCASDPKMRPRLASMFRRVVPEETNSVNTIESREDDTRSVCHFHDTEHSACESLKAPRVPKEGQKNSPQGGVGGRCTDGACSQDEDPKKYKTGSLQRTAVRSVDRERKSVGTSSNGELDVSVGRDTEIGDVRVKRSSSMSVPDKESKATRKGTKKKQRDPSLTGAQTPMSPRSPQTYNPWNNGL